MIEKLYNFLKLHWKIRQYKYYLAFGVFVIYMAIFDKQIVHEFLTFLFLKAGEQLVMNIVQNSDFVTFTVGAIIAVIARNKDKKKP